MKIYEVNTAKFGCKPLPEEKSPMVFNKQKLDCQLIHATKYVS